MKIGMVGLDTSHAVIFARLLNEKDSKYNRSGQVVKAFPGGSLNLPISMSRIKGITGEVEKNGVDIVDSIEEAVMGCDAVLLLSVDGSSHLQQLKRLLPFKIPVFVDKPFALSAEDAVEMARLAGLYQVPLMSSSALRYAKEWQVVSDGEKVPGADCYGPLDFLEGLPGYFWYGIHTIETLYTYMGAGVEWVQAETAPGHDLITARWKDGRIGTFRGNRNGNQQFGAIAHFGGASKHAYIKAGDAGYYSSLLEHILRFFKGEASGPPLIETIEVIRFIEAANKSRQLEGKRIYLQTQ